MDCEKPACLSDERHHSALARFCILMSPSVKMLDLDAAWVDHKTLDATRFKQPRQPERVIAYFIAERHHRQCTGHLGPIVSGCSELHHQLFCVAASDWINARLLSIRKLDRQQPTLVGPRADYAHQADQGTAVRPRHSGHQRQISIQDFGSRRTPDRRWSSLAAPARLRDRTGDPEARHGAGADSRDRTRSDSRCCPISAPADSPLADHVRHHWSLPRRRIDLGFGNAPSRRFGHVKAARRHLKWLQDVSEMVSACCIINLGHPGSVIASPRWPSGFHTHEVATEATGEGQRSLQCGKAEHREVMPRRYPEKEINARCSHAIGTQLPSGASSLATG